MFTFLCHFKEIKIITKSFLTSSIVGPSVPYNPSLITWSSIAEEKSAINKRRREFEGEEEVPDEWSLIRIFDGLISRWIIPTRCNEEIPFKTINQSNKKTINRIKNLQYFT